MPYFRIDDGFPTHPKVLAIPRKDRAATIGLWALAGTWCAHHLTDGRLAAHMVDELGSTKKHADLLVRVGLWTATENGYEFHQWVEHQGASRSDVLAKREAEAERKRRWRAEKDAERAAQRAAGHSHVPDVSQRDNPGTDGGTSASVPPVSEPRPTPPPLPSPTHPSVPFGDRGDGSREEEDVQEVDARAPNEQAGSAGGGRGAPRQLPWCRAKNCHPETRLRTDDHLDVVYRCPECHSTAHLEVP